ncbi:arylamine N-acetyltransferase [Bradyrhizobium sp. Leo170]|uniref:arylamine N-acetyltransferase family protein n=1 Tax=Bradyrhizobium sp. Leo170 TaxID=1571199 RepID=UPI00102E52C9|nr:arylamine N-acetyltransferase [Bradyrhizobium sp. Leo170]TAI63790.1 arylamine N-acetyltransferase [Bradyrhizobium sp. Leo170]
MDYADKRRSAFDLDAYCERISYSGPRTPTMATLDALQACHTSAITFEAIEVLLGRPVDISPAAVDAKLIRARRGGYCFEQNGLFKRALESIGFTVTGLLGRVYWMSPPAATLPSRSHMALRVFVDEESWLVDVGFGTCVPTTPLRLAETQPQRLRHDTFRIDPSAEGCLLQILIGETWTPVYDLSLGAPAEIDYVVANWFTSTHPSVGFRRDLIVARTAFEARYTLLRNKLTVRPIDGEVRKEMLSASGVLDALHEIFLLPVIPEWSPMASAMADNA